MKQILVPTSREARQRLDLDQCQPGDLEHWNLSAHEYGQLWASGFFERLNARLGTLIDDYEDASIQGRAALESSLSLLEQSALPADIKQSFRRLNTLALAKDTGLFFYF